jgi:NAD(P)H-flavin reductase
VDALAQALAQTDVMPDIYACGPPVMIKSARNAALAAHVPAEQFVSENM